MRLNARSSSAWRLYVIVDADVAPGQDLAALAEAAIKGGADAIQLRGKRLTPQQLLEQAVRCAAVSRPAGIPLLINDHPNIAKAAGADGVHLGQEDVPVARAREVLGPGRLIGKSTHSVEQALAAEAEGAAYIGCGPVFATPTKPGAPAVGVTLVREVTSRIRIPVVCIGGVDQGNVTAVLEAGGRCVAVVRAVCAAANPEQAARDLKLALAHFHRAAGVP